MNDAESEKSESSKPTATSLPIRATRTLVRGTSGGGARQSGTTNTYAEPESLPLSLSPNAPATAVSPLSDTEKPKASKSAPSEAVSRDCWLQTVPRRSNTYAEPDSSPLSSSRHAPITAMSLSTDAERPNSSPAAPSEAVSLAC